jgi:hypothetical protein
MWQLPFEYHAFAEKWENITTAQLALRHDEVLAVNCFKLHYLLDESVMVDSPRKIVLNRIRSLNPKVKLQMDWLFFGSKDVDILFFALSFEVRQFVALVSH